MIVSYNWPEVIDSVEKSRSESTTLESTVLVGGDYEGWLNYDEGIKDASDSWVRPSGSEDTSNTDLMLIYFTSGTTSMPKMACHDFTYPLGHIVTAKYWRGWWKMAHLTVAESGWAKFGWESYMDSGFVEQFSLFMIWSGLMPINS